MDYYELKNDETILVSQKAFIVNGHKVLLLKSLKSKTEIWSEKWGLPGGLLEMNEKMPEGLSREIMEETGLKVLPGRVFGVSDFKFDKFIFKDGRALKVRFIEIGFICEYEGGEVTISEEHSGYIWATNDSLKKLDFTPDSKELIDKYIEAL